jgi:hypothetical protein
MLSRALLLAISVYVVFPCACSAAAERFLTPDQMISALADGVPWEMKTSDGMQANLTFRKDGTGIFEGPFTGPSAWTVAGEDICMIIKMPVPVTNRKCFRLARMATGYQAYESGTPVFTLKR